MTTPSTTPMNERDQARTPPSLFKKLNDIYDFALDVAASDENHLCDWYFTQECSALSDEASWHHCKDREGVYCNPPYSRGNIDRFIKKGYEESLKGAVVVMLLPSDTSTRYFHNYCMKASEIIFLYPRVKFNRPNGISFKTSPKFGSMVIVFDEQKRTTSGLKVSSMRWT